MPSRLVCAFSLSLVFFASARAEPPAEAPKGAPTLEQLLVAFKASPGLEARFTEKRVMALLAAPLTSEGVLYFSPPGLLARHVTKPTVSFQVIEPHRVRFGDNSKIETIDLAQRPQVKSFVETFVSILAGDKAALERSYEVRFAALPEGRWRLTLVPRLAPVDKVIATVTLEGQGIVVSQMRLLEVEGDETLTTFTQVDAARRFTEAELDRAFLRKP